MNPVNLRVYYHEKFDRTDDGVTTELSTDIGDMDGVVDVTIDEVHTGGTGAAEAEVSVEFDETTLTSEQVEYNVSTLSYIHNAQDKQ